MGVCHHYRIPHSEFLAWDQDDRDKAIWAWLRDRQTCSQCGTRPDEWDPAQGGDRRAYVAVAEVCRGCQAIETRDKALTDEQRGGSVHIGLRRRGADHAES